MTWTLKTMQGKNCFNSVYLFSWWYVGLTPRFQRCIPILATKWKAVLQSHLGFRGEVQACCRWNGLISFLLSWWRIAAQSEWASLLQGLRRLLAPSTSRENPCSGKEQPYFRISALSPSFLPPPSLSSFTLNKQNTARYSRHILPVAITSMGASAPQTVWCWVPPIGTGYRLLLPTMSVECKCLFKKLCSSIDFISFSLLLARLLLAQVKCLSIMRFSHWSQACCLSHKSRYYSIM